MSEIDRAAKEIEADHDIEFKLIFDGPRNFGEEVVMDVFKMASEDKTGRVIGVGLGGDEKNYPPALFENCFNFARSQGLKTIAHAGETAGEQSMNDAINLLHASRLGHAIGISEGSELESLILDREITLDLCPWSNVATRVINQIEDHPMLDYLNRGLPITLNSDDPGLFFSSLTKEFETMVSLYNISAIQLGQLTKNAIDGSFMDINKKQSLTRRIDKIVAEFRLP